jgi:hypothetical protein
VELFVHGDAQKLPQSPELPLSGAGGALGEAEDSGLAVAGEITAGVFFATGCPAE